MGLEEIDIKLLYCGTSSEGVMYNRWFGNWDVACVPPVFDSLLLCSCHCLIFGN